MEENVSSENCCPRDMYFHEKMLKKQIILDMLVRKRIFGVVGRDETCAFRKIKYCVGVVKNRQCECVIGSNH